MTILIKKIHNPEPEILHYCYMISDDIVDHIMEFFVKNPIDNNRMVTRIAYEELEYFKKVGD